MNSICVIPARYSSTRLPGKPLKDICGVPMICRVWERASRAQSVTEVIVATELKDTAEADNPNNVKVVLDRYNDALYFSRSLIPYPRNAGNAKVFKHIGIYAYRRQFLIDYAKMEPTPLEQSESLEQLRALENGFKIRVIKSSCRFVGVDTAEDLKLVNEIYREEGF